MLVTQIVLLIASTAFGFITLALLARFFMQWGRVSFRNPAGNFVIAVTDWVVMPFRRIVPGLFGLDMASLLPAWIAQVLYATIELVLSGMPMGTLAAVPLFGLIGLARMATYLVFFVVLAAAILSWVGQHSPMAMVFDALARPFLAPFRRLIRPFNGIDLSPLVLLVLLQIVLLVLNRMWLGALAFSPVS
ncbi:MAG: YggT family protein [Azoarcus sp.]|jgi:YggT family protein|nr:YggT family protein [Azoarcus sp.]